jgi:hypothetical protein
MSSFKNYLNEGVVTALIAYSFTSRIATPFDKWKAYKSGMIDVNGKILRKAQTPEEKKQTGTFWNIARKIKILFNKFVPNKKYLALLLGMYLLKKENNDQYENMIKEQLDKDLSKNEHNALIGVLNEISKSSTGVGDYKEKFFVGKDLSKDEARKLGLKKIKKDHRGVSYNPKTGIIVFI